MNEQIIDNINNAANQEKLKAIILAVFPNITQNEESFNRAKSPDEVNGQILQEFRIEALNAKAAGENYRVIIALSRGHCNWCNYCNFIVVDNNLNTISSAYVERGNDNTKIDVVDLECNGSNYIKISSVQAGSQGTSLGRYKIIRFDKRFNIREVFSADRITLGASNETYQGEKILINGKVEFGKCRKFGPKDIVVIRNFQHYDDYFVDGAPRRDILDKPWIAKETWRFVFGKYVKVWSKGKDPFARNYFEKFVNWITSKKKPTLKSRIYPGGA